MIFKNAKSLARTLSLAAALLLPLTACNSSSPEEENTSAPISLSHDASSEGSDSEPGDSNSSGGGPAAPSGTELSDVESTEAGGEGGAYVPASADGPAMNVPKPQMPAVMKEETEEGAKAAVQYWWDTVTYLQRTGDYKPLQMATDDACDFCKAYARDLVNHHETGGWHTGSDITVSSAHTRVLSAEMRILEVTTLLDNSAATTFDKDGHEVPDQGTPRRENEPWITDVRYDPDKGHWRTTYVSFEGPESE